MAAVFNKFTITQLKSIENSFLVLTTDVISTFGLSFSQTPVRLCPVAVPGVLGKKMISSTIPFAEAIEYLENYVQNTAEETTEPDEKRKALNKLLEAMSKFPTTKLLQEEVEKMYHLEAELKVNLYIAEKFLMSLIDGQCVVNSSHKRDMAENLNQNIVTPEKVGWNR